MKTIKMLLVTMWIVAGVVVPGNRFDSYASVQNKITATTSPEKAKEVSVKIESDCRAITKKWVKEGLQEKYSMSAFQIASFDLTKKENDGTIDVLYLPDGAGKKGKTKLNLTIKKSGTTYKVTKAVLAGSAEVDLKEVTEDLKEFAYE